MCEYLKKETQHKIAKEAYITYLDHMNKNESNVVKFLVTIISAMGVFFYAASRDSCNNDNILLSAAIAANVILLWGILYTIAMSYTHRYLQILMTKYEYEYGIIRIAKWNPLKWLEWKVKEEDETKIKIKKYFKKYFTCQIATSPFQAHLLGFWACIILIWIAFFITSGFKCLNLLLCIPITAPSFLVFCLSRSIYTNKLLKIVEDEEDNLKRP